ncbi:MAG: glucoamylase family protein, partial [Rhodothermales bacterium]|nr:glucoamylase family protein [Rhodothermales bacterium]
VYRRSGGSGPYVRLTNPATRYPNFADLDVENGETYTYVLRSLDADGQPGPDSAPVAATPSSGLPDAFLDLLQETAFRYFWEEANAANGLVKDRSTASSPSSIAAVGFGLSAYTVAIDRGYITRAEGVERVLTTLEFFATCPQSPAEGNNACGYRGFFYHFLNMQTGLRAGNSELSTIDTALLLGGVLHVREYFDGADADEVQIRALADQIYERVEWDWAAPRPPLVALGWRPDSGFIGIDWRGYNEAMILYILALGSPTHPLPAAAWAAWAATYDNDWGTFYGYTYLSFPPLFGHQYSHVWVDFRGIQDAYMRERSIELGEPIDYFENSRRATLAQRAYSIVNPFNHPNYGPNEWGLTASDDPFGYRAHGAPPPQSDNGTITPTAPGGSTPFAPEETITALRTFYREYRNELWGRYGFRDAYNIREDWFATDVLGIDQGPILLMIENLRTETIWDVAMQNEAILLGLDRAGFEETATDAAPDAAPLVLALDVFPNPFARRAVVRFTTPTAGPVRLRVYDLLGRHIATLADGVHPVGAHPVAWPAADLASGVYVLQLEAGGEVRTRRVTLVR